jgi:hypothetical protein
MISNQNPPFGYLAKEVTQILTNIMEPVLKKYQLTVTHYQVLNSIPLDDQTIVNKMIRTFIDREWVDAENLYDEETQQLKLTKEGLSAQSTIFNEIHATRKLLFKNISNDDFQIAAQVLQQMIENKKELSLN